MKAAVRFALLALVASLLAACSSAPGRPQHKGPPPAEANTQLGVEYLRKGMNESALEKLKKAVRQDSRYAPAHDVLGLLYEQLGETAKAEKEYRRALSLEPDNPDFLNHYGQFLCTQGKLKKADDYFRKALKDPVYGYPWLVATNAGICAHKGGDVEKAEQYFRQALKQNPGFQPALREMIRISFARGNYLATRAYIQRYEAQKGTMTPELLWIAVRAEHELGDRNAESSYALLLKNRYPTSTEAAELAKWEHER